MKHSLHPRRVLALFTVILIACLFISAFLTVDDAWLVDPDSAAYMGLAQSMMAGGGYTFEDVPHTKYPPLFPLLLAAAGRIGGVEAYGLMQYMILGFWMLLCGLVFLLYSGTGLGTSRFKMAGVPKTRLTGLVFALLTAASIYMLQYAVDFLRTEVVFTFFSLAAVLVALHALEKDKPRMGLIAAFALLFQAAYFTRIAGVTLAGAMLLSLLARREPRAGRPLIAALVLLCAVGPAAWMIRNQTVATDASTTYLSEFTQRYALDLSKNRDLEMERIELTGFLARIGGNIQVFVESCSKMFLNSNKGSARSFLWLTAGVLFFYGMLVCLVRRRSFVDYYCLLYLALYWIWPFNQQQRFYLPLLPFLLEYAAISVMHLNRLLPVLLRHKGVWYVFFALQVPIVVYVYHSRSQQPEIFGRYSRTYFAFAVLLTLLLVAVNLFVILERSRPGGLKQMMKRLRLAVPVLYVASFVYFGFMEIRDINEDHERYLARKAEHPPPARLERIKAHPELVGVTEWILTNTTDEEVIMSDIPKMLHMLSGRRTVPFTFYSKKRKLAGEVMGHEPGYVFYSGEIGWVYHIFKDACRDLDEIYTRISDLGGGEMIEPGLYRMR